MSFRRFLAAAIALAVATPTLAAEPISGKWMTKERDSIIEIGRCGGGMCGKVFRVFKLGADGKQMLDMHNPEAHLRGRPIEGIVVLTDFTDNGSDWRGRIYDPKSGNSYKSFVSRNPDGTLKVQGCIGFICRTLTWTPTH